MDEPRPQDSPFGAAGVLQTLQHALADPLSAASLKLELLERRLAVSGAIDGPDLAERVRAVKGDLAEAGRLIALLERLSEIAGEQPDETSVGAVCRSAGVPFEESEAAEARLRLRRRAASDSVRSVASLVAARGRSSARGQAIIEDGRTILVVDSPQGAAAAEEHPERLLHLPHGEEHGPDLFLARAAAAADGGGLELAERSGRLVAVLSWPAKDLRAGATP